MEWRYEGWISIEALKYRTLDHLAQWFVFDRLRAGWGSTWPHGPADVPKGMTRAGTGEPPIVVSQCFPQVPCNLCFFSAIQVLIKLYHSCRCAPARSQHDGRRLPTGAPSVVSRGWCSPGSDDEEMTAGRWP